MRQFAFVLACVCTLLGSSWVVAADQSSQNQVEAKAFFEKIVQGSSNPVLVALARESLYKLEQPASSRSVQSNAGSGYYRQVEVPLLTQLNNGLAVPAMVNNHVMATFLVDTGATYTVITPRLAKKLGVVITPETPRVSIITANGVVKAPKVTLKNVMIGEVQVQQVTAVVQDLGHDVLLSGLLGMNFFDGLELTVKRDKLIIGVNR
ncbi:MAG: retropepsin-like aspartic protease [Candidatus Melainabacteria bacterium]|nr:retropepsin-like aspartic protease [Candidatus Melainabacteria bacterium]